MRIKRSNTSNKRVEKLNKLSSHPPNKAILFFTIIMIIFGIIMIFDASVYIANQTFGDQFHFLRLQVIWVLASIIPALILYHMDYRVLGKLSAPALVVIIGLLVAVLALAEEVNGSKRWFALGPIPIQPAEFAKPVIIVYLATWLAKQKANYKSFNDALRKDFIPKFTGFMAILSVILILILLEPDLGTTMIIAMTAFAMFFMSGADIAHTLGSLAVTGLMGLVGLLAGLLESYRFQRIKTFFHLIMKGEVEDPRGAGYQMSQILIGIGSSGFWGKGFGQSRQRFGYLVENTAFTDSIYAVILEELGFIGGSILVLLWMFFLWTGLKIARNAPDKQSQLMAAGITIWLALQAFLNMAANVGLVPLTGMPLPFLTYGGSSTVVTIAGVAILLNISRYTKAVQHNG